MPTVNAARSTVQDPATHQTPASYQQSDEPSSPSQNGQPISIATLLREYNTALLVGSMNSRTLLYHQESLSGTWLGLNSICNLLRSGDEAIRYHLWVAAKKTVDRLARAESPRAAFGRRRQDTMNRFLFEVGAQSASMPIDGPHVTYVDPRHHDDASLMVEEARRRSQLFHRRGFKADNILISIPATEAGLQATRRLQKDGIHVNLYMVGSLVHAVACVEAGAAAITIHVREVLEWFERQRPDMLYQRDLERHSGVETIQTIMAYFRLHDIKTKLIGTNFRKMAEIAMLADFDAVSVSTYQLDRLEWNVARYAPGDVPPKAVLLRAKQAQHPRIVGRAEAESPSICEDGTFFKTRVSRESRRMIQSILSEGLERLSQAMDVLDVAVVQEVDKHLELRGFLKHSSSKNRHSGSKHQARSPTVGTKAATLGFVGQGSASRTPERSQLPPEEAVQDEDEVF